MNRSATADVKHTRRAMDLDAIVKVVAVGVPALLILLGFFGAVIGQSAQAITGAAQGFTGLGVIMILLGVMIYLIELGLVYISSQ